MTENPIEALDLINDLPNNEKRIHQIESELYKISTHLNRYDMLNVLTEKKKNYYKERLFIILANVGDLSQPAFEIRDRIEDFYIKKYKGNPKIGRDEFLKHYGAIHKPYDKIKNNIWKLLNMTFYEDEKI